MEIGIVGAGGHGRETFQAAVRCTGQDFRAPRPHVVGFYDDATPQPGLLEKIGSRYLGTQIELPCLIGIGNGRVKAAVDGRITSAPPVIDPLALVGDDVDLGPGCVVFAQATVTTNVTLGRHVHVGRGAAVGHDTTLADHVSIMPLASVSGNVTLGARTFVGTGALVRQGVHIGEDVMVGMGAVVLEDVPDGATVVGNPARRR